MATSSAGFSVEHPSRIVAGHQKSIQSPEPESAPPAEMPPVDREQDRDSLKTSVRLTFRLSDLRFWYITYIAVHYHI